MALALSLSLDLFLMKGNLLIAVRAQPETGRQTDRTDRGERDDRTSPREAEEGKQKKKKKKKEGRTEGCG